MSKLELRCATEGECIHLPLEGILADLSMVPLLGTIWLIWWAELHPHLTEYLRERGGLARGFVSAEIF